MWVEKVAKEFKDYWNFPNCIGALDGKHINVKAPLHTDSVFYNYKGNHSINLIAVASVPYKFLMVDIGGEEGKAMPYMLLADEAFQLNSFTLRSYPRKTLTNEQNIFNYRLSRAQRVVEIRYYAGTVVYFFKTN
ncbi:uncharacterized protein LOC105205140 [Solenopsis invicta]|uniref:uncharacterized protein LOC105205140 n=1 Tax=Solenopsis invicta TaxID=13686 RepID=UPI000E33E351|nr:uncharacterized protein LOC105205140 [Solenopsis invicta]